VLGRRLWREPPRIGRADGVEPDAELLDRAVVVLCSGNLPVPRDGHDQPVVGHRKRERAANLHVDQVATKPSQELVLHEVDGVGRGDVDHKWLIRILMLAQHPEIQERTDVASAVDPTFVADRDVARKATKPVRTPADLETPQVELRLQGPTGVAKVSPSCQFPLLL